MITTEPLTIIVANDPVTCAYYGRDHALLDSDKWKCFKGIAKWHQKLVCMANQAKQSSFCMATKSKYTGMRFLKTMSTPRG
jgi:hypothetical protein